MVNSWKGRTGDFRRQPGADSRKVGDPSWETSAPQGILPENPPRLSLESLKLGA